VDLGVEGPLDAQAQGDQIEHGTAGFQRGQLVQIADTPGTLL
jgi:hypothetical protein